MKSLFSGQYNNKTVLITGDTGFKGSWLSYWLYLLGAKVVGYSSSVLTEPSHFGLLGLSSKIKHIVGDVRDIEKLKLIFDTYQPDLVFHLAAQSLVRPSYQAPIETFDVNLMGTANVLECIRLSKSVKGIINVTSDKCYENYEDDRAYKEEDRMGGYDPYSASKGAAELIANSFRSSFFNPINYGVDHEVILASVRAGNVIGGGDWSAYRLIPDIVKTASKGEITSIRSPFATRPWQHVLEPLSGYLLLGQRIIEGDKMASDGWNFGPLNNETLSVGKVIELAAEEWSNINYKLEIPENAPHEANLLRLDCTKANLELGWSPVWDAYKSIRKTINWYQSYYEKDSLLTSVQIEEYVREARKQQKSWTL